MATVRIYNLSSENTDPQTGQYFAIDGASALQKINYSNLKKGIVGDTAMNTTATTVTGAIAEHSAQIYHQADQITALNAAVLTGAFKLVSYETNYSIGAGLYTGISGQDLNVSTPSGYTPIAITRIATGNNFVVVRSYNAAATGASYVVNLFNGSSSTALSNVTIGVTILYVKTTLIGS